MKFLKKYLLDILVVIAFATIPFVYFMPADMDGRILFRHDAAAGKGLGHEKELFQQQTGEITRWTNSVFGGMPTYQGCRLRMTVQSGAQPDCEGTFGCTGEGNRSKSSGRKIE